MKNGSRHLLIIILFALLYPNYSAIGQDIPLDKAVHTGKLPNGFTYFIRHNNEPKNRVIFYLVNKVGLVPTLDKIDQISLTRAYAIYKELFADASNFTFTFVGNIDTNTIRPLLQKYFSGLHATHLP